MGLARVAGRLVILADDLTGACDAAGTLTRYAAVRVALTARIPPGPVVAVDLDTRALDPAHARRRLAWAARRVPPRALLYKKVDSQLRGNLVAELNGLMDASRKTLVLVPALPEEGRTTVGGVHRVGGRRIALRRLLAGLEAKVQFSDRPHVPSASAHDRLVVVGDARRREDLRRWAALLRRTPGTVAAGSAGLAAELPHVLGWRARRQRVCWRPSRRTLVAVGSDHPRARQQLRYLASRRRLAVHSMEARDRVVTDLRQGLALVIGDRLGRAVRRLNPASLDALVLCGGATARGVLTASGASSLRLRAEVLPRMPIGSASGGAFDGRLVVTKSGAFGPPEALLIAVQALERGHAG